MGRRPKPPPGPPPVVYTWGGGAQYPVAPEVAAAEIERLEAELGHEPNASEFVDAARDKRSPLHKLLPFEKTQREMAEAFLEQCAADVLRHLKVTYITPEDRTITLRARFNIPVGGRRAFVPIDKILSDDDRRRQLLADALRDAAIFINRYAKLLIATGATAHADRLIATLETFLAE